jgi:4-hydroxybenzoyl-CoA reductase beta subunit
VRLPPFAYIEPASLDEALASLSDFEGDCRILAGGTDLLVRMKQRLVTPGHLLSLKSLTELAYIRQRGANICIGAATPLADILDSDLIQDNFPALIEAVASIGAPSIQHFRGTIGGNLCQDNRCQFYNQSAFFRGTRQACHKAGGRVCYAREGGSDRCHSICQSDAAPALTALDARVVLQRKGQQRTLALDQFYTARGEHPHALAADELLTEIQVPAHRAGSGSAYERLAYRSAVDYPVASVGAWVRVTGGKIDAVRLVVGAVSSAPLVIAAVPAMLTGKTTPAAADLKRAAEAARTAAAAFVVNSMGPPPTYRIDMVAVMARRGLEKALARAV